MGACESGGRDPHVHDEGRKTAGRLDTHRERGGRRCGEHRVVPVGRTGSVGEPRVKCVLV